MREPMRPSLKHWWNYMFLALVAFGLVYWSVYDMDGRIAFGLVVLWIAVGRVLVPSIMHEHAGFLNRWVFHDYGKANRRYRQAVASKKATPEAFAALASLSFAEGEYQETADLLKEAVHRSPKDPYLRIMLSKAMVRSGHADEAVEAASAGKTMAERPGDDSPAALMALGDAHKAKGETDAAIDSYNKALSNRPNFVDCRLNLADAYLSKGDLLAATDEVEYVLERDPENPDALYWAGQIAIAKGETKKASSYLQGAVSLRPVNDHSRMVPYETVISSLAQVRRAMDGTV